MGILYHMLSGMHPSYWAPFSGEPCTPEAPCWYLKHPVQLMAVAAVHWVEFLMALQCTANVGLQFLPAYHALISRPSIHFIVFVSGCVAASMMTYYMLPVK